MESDLLFITKKGLTIVSHLAKREIASYNLNRKYPRNNIKKVELPPKVISSSYVNLKELEQRKFGDSLTYFSRVLRINFISDDLSYFYNNIKTLKIKDLKNKVWENNIVGSYTVGENEIKLYDDYLKSIYHELFHMASSCYRNGIDYSGFSQGNIGNGINEGYTELLTRRYFEKVSEFVGSYEEEVRIVEFIEKIVGKEKMESCYLRANLIELLRILRRYLNNDEVVDLISKIDRISYLNNVAKDREYSIILYLEYLKDIYLTIFKCYARKLKNEIKDEKLNRKGIDDRISRFLEVDDIFVLINNRKYPIATIEDFMEIFNETMKTDNENNNLKK